MLFFSVNVHNVYLVKFWRVSLTLQNQFFKKCIVKIRTSVNELKNKLFYQPIHTGIISLTTQHGS